METLVYDDFSVVHPHQLDTEGQRETLDCYIQCEFQQGARRKHQSHIQRLNLVKSGESVSACQVYLLSQKKINETVFVSVIMKYDDLTAAATLSRKSYSD